MLKAGVMRRRPRLSKNPEESVRGSKLICTEIVPGGVNGGDGRIFASGNSIFQSKNRILAVSAPGNP